MILVQGISDKPTIGFADFFRFRNLITLGYLSLILHEKIILPKFQIILPIPRHCTPRLKKITVNGIIKFPYFLTFFSKFTIHGTKRRAKNSTTNIYNLIQNVSHLLSKRLQACVCLRAVSLVCCRLLTR